MRLALLACLLAGCVHPDIHCTGRITGEDWQAMARDAIEDCAPMIRFSLESWTGDTDE